MAAILPVVPFGIQLSSKFQHFAFSGQNLADMTPWSKILSSILITVIVDAHFIPGQSGGSDVYNAVSSEATESAVVIDDPAIIAINTPDKVWHIQQYDEINIRVF